MPVHARVTRYEPTPQERAARAKELLAERIEKQTRVRILNAIRKKLPETFIASGPRNGRPRLLRAAGPRQSPPSLPCLRMGRKKDQGLVGRKHGGLQDHRGKGCIRNEHARSSTTSSWCARSCPTCTVPDTTQGRRLPTTPSSRGRRCATKSTSRKSQPPFGSSFPRRERAEKSCPNRRLSRCENKNERPYRGGPRSRPALSTQPSYASLLHHW